MAYELAVYGELKKVVIHTLTCKTVSTVARAYHPGHVLEYEEDWMVVSCGVCVPVVYVVQVERGRVNWTEQIEDVVMPVRQIRLSDWQSRKYTYNQPESSFPPVGVTALDITHSENRDEWWLMSGCRSGDERLSEWLQGLYEDQEHHWAVMVQKVICDGCEVRSECLEQGVWGHERWGLWGGATEIERNRLRGKWEREGRLDERPGRPRNSVSPNERRHRGSDVYDQDGDSDYGGAYGSGDSASSTDDGRGVDSPPGQGEAAGEGVPEVSPEREVRWSRTHEWTGGRTSGPRSSDW